MWTLEQIAEEREALNTLSPWPWTAAESEGQDVRLSSWEGVTLADFNPCAEVGLSLHQAQRDAAWVANAPFIVDSLLDEVVRLQVALSAARQAAHSGEAA